MTELTYSIPVWETIGKAWDKIKGTKGSVWGAIGLIILIMLGLIICGSIIQGIFPFLKSLVGLILQLVNFLFEMGLLYIGIKRAFDLPISYRLVFRSFETPVALRVIGLYILQILIFIPFTLLFFIPLIVQSVFDYPFSSAPIVLLYLVCYVIGIIGVIYFVIRLLVAMAFVLDKLSNPWEAIVKSFEATRGNFWNLLFLTIIEILILMISAIPLGIGLIWTLPFALILYGIIYKELSVNVTT